MLNILNYSESESDDDAKKRTTSTTTKEKGKSCVNGIDVNTIASDDDETTNQNNSNFSKFQRLKQRRFLISSSSIKKNKNNDINNDVTNKKRRKHDHTSRGKHKVKSNWDVRPTGETGLSTLNDYTSQSFEIMDNDGLAKRKRMEMEVDDAIRNKNFKRAETLSDQITKSDQSTRQRNALEARKFAAANAEKEEKCRKKQQKKLKWAFSHKERWETKGNM